MDRRHTFGKSGTDDRNLVPNPPSSETIASILFGKSVDSTSSHIIS